MMFLRRAQERGLFKLHTSMGLTVLWSRVQSIDLFVVHLFMRNTRRPVRRSVRLCWIRERGPFKPGSIFRQHAEIVPQVAKECECSVPTHNGTLGGDPNG